MYKARASGYWFLKTPSSTGQNNDFFSSQADIKSIGNALEEGVQKGSH